MRNPYLPYPVRIDDIKNETQDRSLKTFKFVFINPEDEEKFAYHAGQFAELSVTGKGEIPIGIASSPVEKGFVSQPEHWKYSSARNYLLGDDSLLVIDRVEGD